MTCINLGLALGHGILCISPDYKIMDRGGRVWWFEFHSYCGPSVLGKRGDPLRNQPPENSPFWDAIEAWIQQGKRTEQGIGGAWAQWDHKSVER